MSNGKSKASADEPILPIRAGKLRTQIHERLRDLLQRGEIGIHERLVDIEIASRFGVSRMPVREALMQLVHEGYLVGTTRGFMLPQLSGDDVAEIFEIRRLLEPRAAAGAAPRITAEGQKALTKALKLAQAAVKENDTGKLMVANADFRRAWLDHVPNRRLAHAISRFADQIQTVRQATLYDPAVHRIVLDGLEKMHDAFQRQDVSSVQDHTLAYIVQAEKQFIEATTKTKTKTKTKAKAEPGVRKSR